MKTKLVCMLLAVSLLSGCRLAVEAEELPEGRDRLIGVFVTPEHLDLFNAEAYFNDHVDEILKGKEINADASNYQNRLYAEYADGELRAGDVEGWFYCALTRSDENGDYIAVEGSEVFSDGYAHIFSGEEERLELACTLYVSSEADFVAAYINPVYQDSDGSIYVVSGSGISSNGLVDGGSMTQTVEENETLTASGERSEKNTRIEVTVAGKDPTETITVYEMSADDSILRRSSIDPDAIPTEWTPPTDCEWIILREDDQRSVYTKEDESFPVFKLRDDGLCVKASVQLNWPEEESK